MLKYFHVNGDHCVYIYEHNNMHLYENMLQAICKYFELAFIQGLLFLLMVILDQTTCIACSKGFPATIPCW